MIRERIIKYLEKKGISKYQFYKDTGLSNGFLDKEGSIGSDKCEKISYQYPDLSLLWLITGKGDMFIKQAFENGYSIAGQRRLKTDRKLSIQQVPLFNIQATAGIVELLHNPQKHIPIDYISIPNLPKCDGAIPITGDSMYPILKSGDIVLYKEVNDKHNIIWGEMHIVAISHNGDNFFFTKYVQKADREGWVRLVSQNKHHQPIEFPLDSIVAIALIKASIRFNTQI